MTLPGEGIQHDAWWLQTQVEPRKKEARAKRVQQSNARLARMVSVASVSSTSSSSDQIFTGMQKSAATELCESVLPGNFSFTPG